MQIQQKTMLAERTVADIMERLVTTVTADAPLAEVARIMWDEQISGLPVVDDVGRPIGFVSASDLVRHRAYGSHYQPPGEPAPVSYHHADLAMLAPGVLPRRGAVYPAEPAAGDIMTRASFSVEPTTTLPALARFLVTAGVHRALVLDDGRLVGIVSAFDIVQEVARDVHEPVEFLVDTDLDVES
jgi:CBS domain-containing protein